MTNEEISVGTKEIIARLAKLQADMNYIKEHIEDTTLTEDDIESIALAEKGYKEGKTKRL